jgi:penicillin-binding protein 2
MSFALKDDRSEKDIFAHRAILASVFVLFLMLVLAGRMYYLQVIKHDVYATKSDNNRVQLQSVAPIRGLIFDRNGVLLAENLPSHSLTVVIERVKDLDHTLALIDTLVGLTDDEKESFTKRVNQWRRPYEAIPIKYKLSETAIAKLMVNNPFLKGVQVEAELIRHYPQGADFAHVLV